MFHILFFIYINSIYATLYLGLTIGFPLTQVIVSVNVAVCGCVCVMCVCVCVCVREREREREIKRKDALVISSSIFFMQVALLVGGLYGIIIFREMKNPFSIFLFLVSALVLLGGSAMLSQYG